MESMTSSLIKQLKISVKYSPIHPPPMLCCLYCLISGRGKSFVEDTHGHTQRQGQIHKRAFKQAEIPTHTTDRKGQWKTWVEEKPRIQIWACSQFNSTKEKHFDSFS